MIEIKIKLWGDTLHTLEMLAEGIDRTPEQLASEIVENYYETRMSDNRQNQKGEDGMTTKMSWTEIMDKARELADSGAFTDDPDEIADDVYLVKDIQDVINAFAKDIEEGKLGTYSEPAEFLDRHGIEWE